MRSLSIFFLEPLVAPHQFIYSEQLPFKFTYHAGRKGNNKEKDFDFSVAAEFYTVR